MIPFLNKNLGEGGGFAMSLLVFANGSLTSVLITYVIYSPFPFFFFFFFFYDYFTLFLTLSLINPILLVEGNCNFMYFGFFFFFFVCDIDIFKFSFYLILYNLNFLMITLEKYLRVVTEFKILIAWQEPSSSTSISNWIQPRHLKFKYIKLEQRSLIWGKILRYFWNTEKWCFIFSHSW